MKEIIQKLSTFILFNGLDEKTLEKVLAISGYQLKRYTAGEIIALEASTCQQLGLIFEGCISISKIYPSGRTVAITTLDEGSIFGEVVLFSNHNVYPSTVIATNACSVLFFEKNAFIKMCNEFPQVYSHLLKAFSDRILLLNQKITNLSFKSIRQKIIHYLFQAYKKQNSLYIDVSMSRNDWAEMLGVPRPSLSRELIKMKAQHLIDFDKSTIQLFDLVKLEDELFK